MGQSNIINNLKFKDIDTFINYLNTTLNRLTDTLFLENLTVTSKLINKIREEKLSKIFERSLEKSLELKTVLVRI